MKKYITTNIVVGAVTGVFMPVYDFKTETFSIINLLFLIFLLSVVNVIVKDLFD